jgi:Flp pilus assembly protein TadD
LPDDRAAIVGLGWLRLYGQDNPDHAFRDLAPLREVETSSGVTAAELELLGAVYRRTDKLDRAVQTLLRAANLPDATAGCFTQLALAYHARGQQDTARYYLERARSLPRSPREHGDYVTAAKLIVQ